jgi:3-hydroxyacyl-[acyl-carrier-protein] dehydratase
MPPPLIGDFSQIDVNRVIYSREEIYAILPQQFEFRQLDAICHHDPQTRFAAARREVRSEEWWVRGHIPGQPIFPGILMLESVAQLSAFTCKYVDGFRGMIAFGGVENCKFRAAVTPPATLLLVCREIENRSRRIVCETQALQGDTLVFEAVITGLALPSPGR